MADPKTPKTVPPTTIVVADIDGTLPRDISSLTPFSAVAPPRMVAASRIRLHISLETIYEEEDGQDAQSSSASFLPIKSSLCFLEAHKPLTFCSRDHQFV
ncbi:hypothetical protein ACJRO7_020868 [Eucalyptus globulus]|uniref:Uncharacterized protein n=1 Tax=Eucalyptus globulus TaxID=34317 RepID=A0ABD3KPL2_EUCGL